MKTTPLLIIMAVCIMHFGCGSDSPVTPEDPLNVLKNSEPAQVLSSRQLVIDWASSYELKYERGMARVAPVIDYGAAVFFSTDTTGYDPDSLYVYTVQFYPGAPDMNEEPTVELYVESHDRLNRMRYVSGNPGYETISGQWHLFFERVVADCQSRDNYQETDFYDDVVSCFNNNPASCIISAQRVADRTVIMFMTIFNFEENI
ncbi:MAG: hypothetical protein V1853_04805 [bacterium]